MKTSSSEKRIVKIGLDTINKPMTIKQAERYGNKIMPNSLKLAGFVTSIFISDENMNGGLWYRINFAKVC